MGSSSGSVNKDCARIIMEGADRPLARVPELFLVGPHGFVHGQSRDGREAEDLSQASAVGHIVSFVIDLGGSGVIHQGAINIHFSALERDGQIYFFIPKVGFLHLGGILHGGSHGWGMHRDGCRSRACFFVWAMIRRKSCNEKRQ